MHWWPSWNGGAAPWPPGSGSTSLSELPPSTAVVLDTSANGLATLAGDALPPRYRRSLGRFRYGPGVCKVDWALSGPVPWSAAVCRRAGTLHVGGTVGRGGGRRGGGDGRSTPGATVLPGGADRAWPTPPGRRTGSTPCGATATSPPGSTVDMTGAIEAQIERFAPGFSDLVIARSTSTAAEVERRNPNYVGGDIGGGAPGLRQTLLRPTAQWNPYRTPLEGVYLCSASTPPGGGVHGMCGVYAARTVLHDHFGGPSPLRG